MTRGRRFAIRHAALLPLVLACAVGLAAPARAGLWEWADGAGRPHKSRSLDEVPEEFRSTAVEVPDSSAKPAAEASSPQAKGAERTPARARGTAGESPDASSAVDKPATDRDGHDQAWWQSQVVETRRTINELEAKIEHLKGESIRTPLIRKEREARKEFAKAQAELAEARKRLSVDLPQQAAAAGAPTYWLQVK